MGASGTLVGGGDARESVAVASSANTLTSERMSAPGAFSAGVIEIRPPEFDVLLGGRRVGLTVREFQTLLVLVERSDRVVTRPDIYTLVWGGQMKYRDRLVDVYVRKVRSKLRDAAPEWAFIHTHFGIGYRFAPERAETPAESPRGL